MDKLTLMGKMDFFIVSQMRKGNEEYEEFQDGKYQSLIHTVKAVIIEGHIYSSLIRVSLS